LNCRSPRNIHSHHQGTESCTHHSLLCPKLPKIVKALRRRSLRLKKSQSSTSTDFSSAERGFQYMWLHAHRDQLFGCNIFVGQARCFHRSWGSSSHSLKNWQLQSSDNQYNAFSLQWTAKRWPIPKCGPWTSIWVE
jgi:hypothetical protein